MAFHYWAESGELWVAEADGIRWHGKPDGQEVWKATALPGTPDAIVLLNVRAYPGPKLYGRVPNLVRCRPDGTVFWKAQPPDTQDVFTDFTVTEAGLSVYSFGGFSNKINAETGQIIESFFTK